MSKPVRFSDVDHLKERIEAETPAPGVQFSQFFINTRTIFMITNLLNIKKTKQILNN